MAKKAEDLRRNWLAAKERINKIGKREPHLGANSVGCLSAVAVKTTIHHQDAPSAKNYWDDEQFDFALAKVIRYRFAALADEALALMQSEADTALVAEEADLRSRLAEIERIKAGA